MLLMQVAPRLPLKLKNQASQKIQITDNGEGMAQADVAMSLRRHATSKIKKSRRSLSYSNPWFFEVRPSLYSFYQLLNYCDSSGWRSLRTKLVAKVGEIESQDPISTPVGTKITVENPIL